jgi:endonuclease/exonuclease/phosphatase family metal-dependent hydrolase
VKSLHRIAGPIAAVGAAILVVGSAGATTRAGADHDIDVVSYNVLAPIWASPVWYPEIDEYDLLDADDRRESITAYLESIAPTAEIVCLQEVQASELHAFEAALPGFVGGMAVNDEDFWSNWIIPPITWEPNGTAIYANDDVFDDIAVADVALGTGNHGSLLTAIHTATDTPVRAWSLHLDSDRTNNRGTELRTALAMIPAEPGTVDILCGDFNEDTVVGTVAGIVKRAGFTDVLAAVGERSSTHPWSDGYYKSGRWAVLDHVLVRGAEPVAGEVVDADTAEIADQSERIEEFLRRMGSDHYPVAATVRID